MTLAKDSSLDHDRYIVGALLAEGGMGAIYTAYDSRFKKRVALKENFFQDEAGIQQFENEASILHGLSHPGLPGVDNHFRENGKQYLVMQFIDGQNLWEMVKPDGEQDPAPLPEKQALDYIIQVCQAVNYLHQQEPPIIHRDIKPENIRISKNRAVLVDFGIAKVMSSGKTHVGAAGWTEGYAPPEQYGVLTTTPKSDIYALGATLYAILTGTVPPSSMRLMMGEVELEPLERLNPNLSPGLYEAVSHAMQTIPVNRPQTVTDWQAKLKAILAAGDVPSQEDTAAVIKDEEPTRAVPKSGRSVRSGGLKGKQTTSPLGLASAVSSSVIATFGLDAEEQAFVSGEIRWLFSAADNFLKIYRGDIDRSQPIAVSIPEEAERDGNANNRLLRNVDDPDINGKRQIESYFARINTHLGNLEHKLKRVAHQGSAAIGDAALQNDIKWERVMIVKVLREMADYMNQAYGVLVKSPDELIEFVGE